MDQKKKKNIFRLFKAFIKSIFRDELVFAFICGSITRSKMNNKSDIDMFVCIWSKDMKKRKKFQRWYKNLHRSFNLSYDRKFPGEIVTVKDLDYKLHLVKKASPQLILKDPKLYDGLVWAGMLSSKIGSLIGGRTQFIKRKKLAEKIVKVWRGELLQKLSLMEPSIFLKHLVRFKS